MTIRTPIISSRARLSSPQRPLILRRLVNLGGIPRGARAADPVGRTGRAWGDRTHHPEGDGAGGLVSEQAKNRSHRVPGAHRAPLHAGAVVQHQGQQVEQRKAGLQERDCLRGLPGNGCQPLVQASQDGLRSAPGVVCWPLTEIADAACWGARPLVFQAG